ncbi:MAG: Spy/CpxP family protein refolding chaperone [Alphaproteobacteria bacterium]|nr:Spy/CpxP family protein refolding chaperone [Alphaproteobacteria bacterium]
MKRIISMVIGAAGLSALALGGLAVAGPPGGPGGFGPHGGIEGQFMRVLHELDLTDAQKAQLREIREANRDDMEAAHAEREANLAIVKAQLLSDTPDVALLHQMIDDQAIEMQARAHDRMDTILEIQALLTPDQRALIAAELDDARERWSDRRERFRNGEGPRAGEGPRFRE